jgi:hypothetical protein
MLQSKVDFSATDKEKAQGKIIELELRLKSEMNAQDRFNRTQDEMAARIQIMQENLYEVTEKESEIMAQNVI